MPKSRVLEALERLKAQERPKWFKERPIVITKERSEPVKTIQQHKVKELLSSIENMEKKMKQDSKNYLGMYWDLAKLEKRFLAAVEEMERSNIKPAELFDNEIQKRKAKIEAKFGKLQDLYKDRMEEL
ncbi:MAG: hypothetical protein AB1571_01570 [Nanoarchaeota archaeon]